MFKRFLFASLLPFTFYLLPFIFTSCEDEVSSQYSTHYPVRFYMEVNTSAELINTMGNPGQFVTIRQRADKIRIENDLGGNDYSPTYIGAKDFRYGLGGLIVGTSDIPGESGMFDKHLAYDLACPTCNRAERRLSVAGGVAKCAKCGLSYNLNDNGVVLTSENSNLENVRGLYKYRIVYNGVAVNVFN